MADWIDECACGRDGYDPDEYNWAVAEADSQTAIQEIHA